MTHPDAPVTRQLAAVASESQHPPEAQTATFGMGCFWGPDARFGAMEGVVRTRVGYAGGTTPNPSYYSLGDHTEVIQLEFDPETLSYEELLEVFWANHTWQSSSRKRQYRGVVLAHTDEQYETAQRTKDDLAERTGATVVSEIEVLESITLAEDYHQKYELRSTPVAGDELADRYGDEFVDSTVVARLNGFVAGHGTEEQRRRALAALDVPATVVAELRRRF
ncbi:peptide methionine sulfoxide reductase [Natrialba chahannaoensis JCM 10990]|uniref:Peptide methionine sulfoxide reductase MsrA n=1 Tax=Natrialba chahannaoensis JCM 10990 TaxID=1227492 RepID=M0AFU7_9EURY|nr:peptide methionine sulfoxide reductase [Natrialba chahannaoensis JCM 10990]